MPSSDRDPDLFLRATATMDFNSATVKDFIVDHSSAHSTQREQAISLYYAVRDQIRYDPYTVSADLNDYSASHTLLTGRGWCVSKAILYAACCRGCGIQTRLGYADVRNHMSTENLRQLMGTDIFYWHGYTEVYLNGIWVKATPAFNIELCERFRLQALEFDGLEDSIYHPFDLDGRKHMEYLNYHGEFADLPFDRMISDFARYYPNFTGLPERGNFEQEVALETSN